MGTKNMTIILFNTRQYTGYTYVKSIMLKSRRYDGFYIYQRLKSQNIIGFTRDRLKKYKRFHKGQA